MSLVCPTYTSNTAATRGGYGIKTWYPQQGVIVNNYASLWRSFTEAVPSTGDLINTPSIPMWLGTTLTNSAMATANCEQLP